MNSKLLLSKLFIANFKAIYDAFCKVVPFDQPFEKVFEDNVSRLKFLNLVMEHLNENKFSLQFSNLFSQSIDFMSNYINGNYKCGIDVPYIFKNDEQGKYVPTEFQLVYLFKMMGVCCDFHKRFYDGKEFSITLPNNTLNQNIVKKFTINRENLPHILGLTEHEDKGNYLFKYFLENDRRNNPDLYTTAPDMPLSNGQKVSERYLDWVLSDEGQEKIIEMNNMIRDLMSLDMMDNPQNYENGQPKSKERFAALVKSELGFDFPLIKYSRYICKTINLFNFLNMNSTQEMILDYNPQVGENIPFDFFLVNASNEALELDGKSYVHLKEHIFYLIGLLTSDDPVKRKKAEDDLRYFGIKIDYTNADSVGSYANLLLTDKFVGKHGIVPALSGTKQSLLSSLGNGYPNDVHLLGFGSKLSMDKVTGVNESLIEPVYCGSSMAVNVPEYLDKFNVRGRCFYLDGIDEGSIPGYVGSVDDEVRFLERQQLLGFDNSRRIAELLFLRKKFNNSSGAFGRGSSDYKKEGIVISDIELENILQMTNMMGQLIKYFDSEEFNNGNGFNNGNSSKK